MYDKKLEINHINDRPGHDFRYSVNCDKIHKIGWKPVYNFQEGLEKCVDWYLNNDKFTSYEAPVGWKR